MALGASPGKVLRMVLRETAVLGALGVAAASALLLIVALVAGFIPARRASRTDPITALRYE